MAWVPATAGSYSPSTALASPADSSLAVRNSRRILPQHKFRTVSDERAGPGNKATTPHNTQHVCVFNWGKPSNITWYVRTLSVMLKLTVISHMPSPRLPPSDKRWMEWNFLDQFLLLVTGWGLSTTSHDNQECFVCLSADKLTRDCSADVQRSRPSGHKIITKVYSWAAK